MVDSGMEKVGLAPVKVGPSWELSDIPFMRSYVEQNYSTHTQPIEDFYKHASANEAYLKTRDANKNNPDALREIEVGTSGYDTVNFTAAKKALNTMQNAYMNIYKNPEISPSDKRQQLNEIADQMNVYAEQQNKEMYNLMLEAKKLKAENQKVVNP